MNLTDELPISIQCCDDLLAQFTKITSVCDKLEAQFNFQTMTANWYGDESNILFVNLSLETLETLETLESCEKTHKENSHQKIHRYSDDVFSLNENRDNAQILTCYIAITESELIMLNQQPKLLAGLLQIKLQKVLNLIAKQLNLNAI